MSPPSGGSGELGDHPLPPPVVLGGGVDESSLRWSDSQWRREPTSKPGITRQHPLERRGWKWLQGERQRNKSIPSLTRKTDSSVRRQDGQPGNGGPDSSGEPHAGCLLCHRSKREPGPAPDRRCRRTKCGEELGAWELRREVSSFSPGCNARRYGPVRRTSAFFPPQSPIPPFLQVQIHHTGATDILLLLPGGPASSTWSVSRVDWVWRRWRLFSTASINPWQVQPCDAFTNQNKSTGQPVSSYERPSSVLSECNNLGNRQELFSSGSSPHSGAGSARMLTSCAADTVTELTGQQCCLVQPYGLTSVLLSAVSLILPLCMAAGRSRFSVRAVGAGGTNMICCSMTLQSERKRERDRERDHLSTEAFLLILSICLPALMLQVKLAACTGDPGLRGSQPCWLVFTPREPVLCWFWCTCAVLWLHASSVPLCNRILVLQLGDC